ncbi:hypothetical protein [Anaerorhabdus sp.]|uniref:Uncharacterized protein n=1 Tax=bioreactor metagenome TaxID=1076179 RepID=A0A645DV33_9ZZZZ|nr:hypothetical protein [Anaerorhabdus sp.]MEA4876127.1 hypothetical protein [Anaerorhabdus sp.]
MIKKILISFMSLCFVVSMFLAFYCFFKPSEADTTAVLRATPIMIIPYGTLSDYLTTSGDSSTHYLFFCRFDSDDCNYVQDTVMKSLDAEQGSNLFDIIEYVDVSELENNLTINQLKDDWGFNTYPAFVAISNNSGELKVENYLQWDSENPMSTRELKQWMVDNKIWSGLFEEKDEVVLMP